jgi:acetyl-CoA carboxylase carboxyltransferase component
MYQEWGEIPAAGVITGIGKIVGRDFMIIANDATVKAGAMFPQSIKKVLRAQRIAFECRLPIIYLVDSSGVFLPLQDEIFPDEDDFGRIFRNNAVISAAGLPQYAAIMGNCIAGGGYLPVLCDKLLMTEGSGLYLAGPALVKAAIGHDIDAEHLGGVKMHSEISGTVDFHEKDDASCLKRLRKLVDLLPLDPTYNEPEIEPKSLPHHIYDFIDGEGKKPYDVHELLDCIVDKDSIVEYKGEYGKTLVTAYAKIQGQPVGIVANQREQMKTGQGEIQIGGVLYAESADKAARFVMECNQTKIPLIFLQDVMGFMVGPAAEQSGIIRSGAKLVNAVSNSIVPKITIVVGSSFGAGNYALCGKAYDPNFILAWPNAKYAVMGGDQAASTLSAITDTDYEEMRQRYEKQMDIRYGAARGWIDGIIPPHATREVLIHLLRWVKRAPLSQKTFHTGVMQV